MPPLLFVNVMAVAMRYPSLGIWQWSELRLTILVELLVLKSLIKLLSSGMCRELVHMIDLGLL